MDAERKKMVDVLRRYKIHDERVLAAMGRIRRHVFIPAAVRGQRDPYGDHPCPIGCGQTISQPFMVAYMTQRMELKPGDRVLEIGTGSGYQAAVLAELGAEVFSVEIIPELAAHARRALAAEGFRRVRLKLGDGYQGWREQAPFDAVIVTCAPDNIPPSMVRQLCDGGRMILPVGTGVQQLTVLEKEGNSLCEVAEMAVRFVPMVRARE